MSTQLDHCPICKVVTTVTVVGDRYHVPCRRCGEFQIDGTAASIAEQADSAHRWLLSAWVANNPVDVVNSEHLKLALTAKAPSLTSRAMLALRILAKLFPQGVEFSISGLLSQHSDLVSRTWSPNEAAFIYLIREVLRHEMQYITEKSQNIYSISPPGWMALEGAPTNHSKTAFIAMWFDVSVFPLFTNVIEPAIQSAGYDPIRIDKKDHNNKIDDEIVASIRAARFVVADYTGERGGVYYEAGFAHGLGLPVIFMARTGTPIHFDTRQYNTIFWKPDELDEAKRQLTNRILATIGRGPLN